jgi:phosphatidylserine/phosphatidylglycerophosphate/cardiolipin synthase-like enzyme
MSDRSVPTAFSCSGDATALAALPKLKPDVDLVQRGAGGPLELAIVGRPPATWFPDHLAPDPGNEVIPYVYGRCLFQDIASALKTAISADHRIYLLGWDGEKGTELTPGKTLEQYLAATRAHIRAMFFDNIVLQAAPALQIRSMPAPASPWLNAFINTLANGASIIDSKHAQPATHHQKLLVVQGSLGAIAFIGGMNIVPNRANVNPAAGEPWHDVHLRLTGPAALACREVFKERWLDHPQVPPLDRKLGLDAFPSPPTRQLVPSVTSPTDLPRPAARWVRIGRTYPKLRKWGGGADFGFAPNGIYTTWELVQHGIATARRFIYLEDQYLISRMARKLLIDKVKQPGFELLLILMNGSGAATKDSKFLVSERNRFRQDLREADKSESKWGIYTLKDSPDPERQKWCGTYMHSKTWIFDDEFAIVGSANCENRGYTLNTEAVAAVADDIKTSAIGHGFGRWLRIMLWRKHLGVSHTDVQDWKRGLSLWRNPPPTAMVQKSIALERDPDLGGKFFPDASEKPNVERLWTTLCDPDAR